MAKPVKPVGNGVIKSMVKYPTNLPDGSQWHVVDDDDTAHVITMLQEVKPNTRGQRRRVVESNVKGAGIIKENRQSRWYGRVDTIELDDF